MAPVIYALCAITSMLCSWLLLRGYRSNGYRLLFWSGLCFVGLSINNVLLILDRVVFATTVDLTTWRLATSLIALLPLLYGLIWEE
ncbi:DUF5985 family protein [Noviherbaspirillum sp. Root189]|uniref:DUF5985 family protein n=1 Tax=Noviherbaspirillum sp. Root189 TaxID=1736487 RepID=UPI0007106BF8|nr:DUF5985 family protein [Noviherbaspirillum sp. Root189]KRB94182.1 hypothetical protein ASE07_01205 [Noviherbaspirillum sp. Root189]